MSTIELDPHADPYRPPATQPRFGAERAPDDVRHGAWLAFQAWTWTPVAIFWLLVLFSPWRVLPTPGQLVLFFGFVVPVVVCWLRALVARTRRTAHGVALGGSACFLVTTSGLLLLFGLAG